MKQLALTRLAAAHVPSAVRCRDCGRPGDDLCGECWAERAETAQELRDHLHMLGEVTDAEGRAEVAETRRQLRALEV